MAGRITVDHDQRCQRVLVPRPLAAAGHWQGPVLPSSHMLAVDCPATCGPKGHGDSRSYMFSLLLSPSDAMHCRQKHDKGRQRTQAGPPPIYTQSASEENSSRRHEALRAVQAVGPCSLFSAPPLTLSPHPLRLPIYLAV